MLPVERVIAGIQCVAALAGMRRHCENKRSRDHTEFILALAVYLSIVQQVILTRTQKNKNEDRKQ
jgi:hypothetical protein